MSLVDFSEFFKKLKRLKLEDGEFLEIELRLLIDSRINSKNESLTKDLTIDYAKNLIEKFKDNETQIEQTINIFAVDEKTFKQLLFIEGEKKKDHEVIRQKIPLIYPVFMNRNKYFSYKLTASIEKPTNDFDLTRVSFTRVKLRYSIDLNDDWRLDITLTKTLQNISANPQLVKDAKTKMFFQIDKSNFIEKAPWHEADAIEFELEYIGQLERFSIESLRIADKFRSNGIDDVFNNEHDDISDNESNNAPADVHGTTPSITTLQQGLYQIAKKIEHERLEMFKKKFGLKQLSNQVFELNKNIFIRNVFPEIKKYYITDKVDGERNMLYLSTTKAFAISSKFKELPLSEIKNLSTDEVCIVDCEEYKGVYFIFDVLFYGKSLTQLPFDERKAFFEKAASHWKDLRLKPFELLTENFQTEIADFKKRKVPYITDGLVLTPRDETYFEMRCYKYKPITHLTVDFLIKSCPEGILGVKPYVEKNETWPLLLFCGVSKNIFLNLRLSLIEKYEYLFPWVDKKQLPDFFPYQFQPSDSTYSYLFWPTEAELKLAETIPSVENTSSTEKKPSVSEKKSVIQKSTTQQHLSLNGIIGEFLYDLNTNEWRLQRLRLDRMGDLRRRLYFGNGYKIAEQNWFAYKNPLNIETLDLADPSIYFGDKDTELQKNSRNFNSFVKTEIFNQLRNIQWVLDMASGNGQDLFRYAEHKVKNVLFTEIDKTAIEELILRKNQFAEKSHMIRATKMLVSQIDFLDDYRKAIQKIDNDHVILPENFDFVICNFAFHYFAKSSETLDNAIQFVNSMLKIGGQIIFTAFDGRKVIKLLNDHNGNYKIESEKGQVYGIRLSDYKVNYVAEIPGQQIEVLLPFSGGKYYKEFLLTEKIAENAFMRNGFIKVSVESFGNFIPSYKNNLTDNDKEYVSLYSIYTFKKKESKYETFDTQKEADSEKKSDKKTRKTTKKT